MNTGGEVVFLISEDVDRILRILYHGSRPTRIHFLICSCGRVAQLTQSDADAIGWQILPNPRCPDCVAGETYQGPARERYIQLVNKLTSRKEGV
jgi:hypothetical protein